MNLKLYKIKNNLKKTSFLIQKTLKERFNFFILFYEAGIFSSFCTFFNFRNTFNSWFFHHYPIMYVKKYFFIILEFPTFLKNIITNNIRHNNFGKHILYKSVFETNTNIQEYNKNNNNNTNRRDMGLPALSMVSWLHVVQHRYRERTPYERIRPMDELASFSNSQALINSALQTHNTVRPALNVFVDLSLTYLIPSTPIQLMWETFWDSHTRTVTPGMHLTSRQWIEFRRLNRSPLLDSPQHLYLSYFNETVQEGMRYDSLTRSTIRAQLEASILENQEAIQRIERERRILRTLRTSLSLGLLGGSFAAVCYFLR